MRQTVSSIGRLAVQAAIVLGMGWLLFTQPAVFDWLVSSLLTLGFGLFALAGAILVWHQLAPVSLSRFGFKVSSAPSLGFVGQQGLGSSLRIIGKPAQPLRVEWALHLFVLAILTACGPGLIALFIFQPKGLNTHLPLPVLLMLASFVALLCLLLVHSTYVYLWDRPALEVTLGAIALKRGERVVRSVRREDIDSLRIEPHSYFSHSDGPSRGHPNFILTARLAGGEDVRLCISDQRQQIEQLHTAIRSRMSLGPDLRLDP